MSIKNQYKKKVMKLKTISSISTYSGIALGVATMCVGFTLTGLALFGCLLGGFAIGVVGITLGVAYQSKADSLSINDFMENNVEVSNLEQQKESEPKLVATHQEEKQDDKQNSEDQNLSL